jgi:hypothetical protein
MSELGTLSEVQLAIVQRCVGHWTERLQVTPEEFARTYNMNPAMLRSIMDGNNNVWSHADAETFKTVACSELTEAEKFEIEDYKWQAQYDKELPKPRTIVDVIDELNKDLKG